MKLMRIDLEDAGKIYDALTNLTDSKDSPQASKEKRYPTLDSGQGEIPGIDNLEVGKKYICVSVVEVTSEEQREDDKGKSVPESLKFLEMGFEKMRKKDPEEMSDEELNTDETYTGEETEPSEIE